MKRRYPPKIIQKKKRKKTRFHSKFQKEKNIERKANQEKKITCSTSRSALPQLTRSAIPCERFAETPPPSATAFRCSGHHKLPPRRRLSRPYTTINVYSPPIFHPQNDAVKPQICNSPQSSTTRNLNPTNSTEIETPCKLRSQFVTIRGLAVDSQQCFGVDETALPEKRNKDSEIKGSPERKSGGSGRRAATKRRNRRGRGERKSEEAKRIGFKSGVESA